MPRQKELVPLRRGVRGAYGEGTSGSGVEGGCAGQQGGGAGRADGGRREGRPGRAAKEQDRGTAGPPAGARGGGGAETRGRRRPGRAGEALPGVGGKRALGAAGGLPPGFESFLVGRGSQDGESGEYLAGEHEAVGSGGGHPGEMEGSRLPARALCRTRPFLHPEPIPGWLRPGAKACTGEGAVLRFLQWGEPPSLG